MSSACWRCIARVPAPVLVLVSFVFFFVLPLARTHRLCPTFLFVIVLVSIFVLVSLLLGNALVPLFVLVLALALVAAPLRVLLRLCSRPAPKNRRNVRTHARTAIGSTHVRTYH